MLITKPSRRAKANLDYLVKVETILNKQIKRLGAYSGDQRRDPGAKSNRNSQIKIILIKL